MRKCAAFFPRSVYLASLFLQHIPNDFSLFFPSRALLPATALLSSMFVRMNYRASVCTEYSLRSERSGSIAQMNDHWVHIENIFLSCHLISLLSFDERMHWSGAVESGWVHACGCVCASASPSCADECLLDRFRRFCNKERSALETSAGDSRAKRKTAKNRRKRK